MAQPPFDPAHYTATSREAWSTVAREFATEHAPRLEPYGLKLLDMLDLDALPDGARVLDLASGPGEPALTIAQRLEGRATVVGSDLAPEMLDIARAAAAGKGL